MTGKICRHCKERKALRPRGLCCSCYAKPEISALYPSESKNCPCLARDLLPHDEDLTQLEQWRAKHPLWKACAYPPTDERYNEVVMLREIAGLPARHPDDLEPDLS